MGRWCRCSEEDGERIRGRRLDQYRAAAEGEGEAERTRADEDRFGSFASECEVVVGLHAEEDGPVFTLG